MKFTSYKYWLNEKFTSDSDPIYDLHIGIINTIEKWLKEHDITNTIINKDLTIDAINVDFHKEQIKKLPDYIKFNHVKNIDFHESGLVSLKGFPKIIDQNLYIGKNKLTSLEPIIIDSVGGNMMLFLNDLKTLKGCPKKVGENFNCSHNKNLKSLKYMPTIIEGDFICFNTGMSDDYVRNFLKNNNIIVGGRKIITHQLAFDNGFH